MIRKSPIAGTWYAGSKSELLDQIKGCFMDKRFGPGSIPKDCTQVDCYGIISPHAGIRYSGCTAAHAYKSLKEHMNEIDTAIIIGPNHTGIGSPISFSEYIWETPIGSLKIDEDILNIAKRFQFSTTAKVDETAHQNEHSIEIQLPFLQFIYDDFEIFPICVLSQGEYGSIADFLKIVLSEVDKRIAIIASSDLSHEYSYTTLEYNDSLIKDAILNKSADEINEVRIANKITMCGYGPVLTLLSICNTPTFLAYSNSSQITNNFEKNQYRVGYSAFGLELRK